MKEQAILRLKWPFDEELLKSSWRALRGRNIYSNALLLVQEYRATNPPHYRLFVDAKYVGAVYGREKAGKEFIKYITTP
jgi:hypothetical protein